MKNINEQFNLFLKGAITKLEELKVQTALGKAELSDKLEELKREATLKISQAKVDLNVAIKSGQENYEHLKAKLEHLELQLALGKAETAEELSKQKKNIKAAIHDVKVLISKD